MKKLIIFIHGWGNSSKSFRLITKALGDDYDALLIDYETKDLESFDDLINPIKKQIQEKEAEYDSFIFVGHSFGGVISRFLIQEFPEKTTQLVTLGSPHKGAVFVDFMKQNKFLKSRLDNMAELLSPESTLIKTIPDIPEHVEVICFSGVKKFSLFHSPSYVSWIFHDKSVTHDGMITIEESLVENSKHFIVRENHARLPLNKEVYDIIKKEILK